MPFSELRCATRQFFIDVEAADLGQLERALTAAKGATSELRVLGRYAAASR